MSRRPRQYYIKTWGCQMNAQDEQKMASLLEAEGYRPTPSASEADVVLLNTCSVREKSAEKLFTFLGRIKKLKERSPQAIIGVAGCVAQQEGKSIFSRAPHVDLVFGPRRIGRLPDLVSAARSRFRTLDTAMNDLTAIFWDGGEAARPGGKAFLTIMEGCNMACAFCVVPRTRGQEVHRPFQEVVAEARRRVSEGTLELELLGQTVNAYRDGRQAFHHLLDAVARLPGLVRLRFNASHPAFFTANTAAVMAAHETICPQLHLPVQSGSDRVLKAMRRGYRIGEYRRRLDDLRRRIPAISVSTDIIVGFPSETEEDFRATMDLLREVRFTQVFAFNYSPRPQTPAESLADDVASQVKARRLTELFTLQDRISLEENRKQVGRTLPVLFDGPSRRDPEVASGRTPCNRVVNVPGLEPRTVIGEIREIHVAAAHAHSLTGELPAVPRLANPAGGVNSALTSGRVDPISSRHQTVQGTRAAGPPERGKPS
jgi:tRNA-2-methylthio-N6-dimethylallyladenosine synthase